MTQPDIETALRRGLTDTRTKADIMSALELQPSDVSRILAGQQGIPLAKLDKLMSEIGYVPVEQSYFSAVQTMSVFGAIAGKKAFACAQNTSVISYV